VQPQGVPTYRDVRDRDVVSVLGTGSWLPERVVTNEELAGPLGVTADWIEERTGVLERRVADEADATSDIATRAARQVLAASGVDARDLDMIVVATSTPDMPIPATACQVQANLGANRTYAVDLDAVCAGFVYALGITQKTMRGDPGVRHALVIGADTYSRILDYRDRRTCVLFGDGAVAVVLGRGDGLARVGHAVLGSDGSKSDYVTVPAGGSRRPADQAALAAGAQFFKDERPRRAGVRAQEVARHRRRRHGAAPGEPATWRTGWSWRH
jgi:acetoacetyl-CoA synthase